MQQMFGLVSARTRVGRTGNQIFLLYDSAAVCCVFTGRLFTNILSIILTLFVFLMPFFSSDPSLNHTRRRHSSGNISTTLEMLPGLEGFHLDTYGRVENVDLLLMDTCFYDPKQFLVVRSQKIFLCLCQSVSYAQFLYPTNALVRQKPSSASDLTLQIPVSRSTHSIPGRSYPSSRLSSTVGLDLGKKWNRAQSQ